MNQGEATAECARVDLIIHGHKSLLGRDLRAEEALKRDLNREVASEIGDWLLRSARSGE